MKAYYINPEDIGAAGYYSEEWVKLCMKLGYPEDKIPHTLLLVPLETNY